MKITHNGTSHHQINAKIHFIDLYIVFYILVAMSGSLSQTFLYVVMGLLVGLLLLLIFNIRIGNSKINNSYYLILFYLLYIFIIGLPVAGLFFTAKQVGAALIQFSPLIIYHYIKAKMNKGTQQFILKCIFVILIYYLVSSYFVYTRLGVDARRIANQSADYGNLAIGGGYSFAYAIALFAVYLFDRLRNKAITDYKERIFYIVLIILSTLVIFETRSTITFLAYLTGLLLTFLSPISKNGKDQYLLFYTKVLLLIIMLRWRFF